MRVLIILLLTINSCYATELAGDFEEALIKSREPSDSNNAYSSESLELQQIVEHFSNTSGPILSDCSKSLDDPDYTPFHIVYVLSEHGKVEKVYRDLITDIGNCFAKTLEKSKFPKPIISPLYIDLKLTFSGVVGAMDRGGSMPACNKRFGLIDTYNALAYVKDNNISIDEFNRLYTNCFNE